MSNRAANIRFPTFNGFCVRVILSENVIRTQARLGAGTAPCVAFFLPDGDDCRAWLVLPAKSDEATVAHEAAHAIRYLFRFTGVRNDDEAFAYHLDYLVGRIHRFMKKGRK